MRHESTSLDALVPVLRQLILAELLVRSSGKPMYRVELARRLGVSPSSLQRPLSAMVRTGILRAVRHGREVHYEPNRENPLLPELESLVRKTRGLADVIRAALRPFGDRARLAFIYGSMAAGNERPSSDVDLFVVGDATLGELSQVLGNAERTLGREVNAVVRTADEFRSRLQTKNHFIRSLLDKPKLFVVGTEHDLGELTGAEARGAAPDEQGRAPGALGRGRKKSSRRQR